MFCTQWNFWEELAIALSLNTDTQGETVFQEVKTYFETNAIPFTNVAGALSMMGRYRRFNAFLKSKNPNVIICHCLIHRQHLVAQNISGRLNQSMKTVFKAVTKIKAHTLHTCLFKQLCHENDEAFERSLLHTEVQRFSKGNCLARFNLLFDTVVEILQNCDPGLAQEVMLISNDSAHLLDIIAKFNQQNLSFQENKINLTKEKSALSGFNNRLTLYQRNLVRRHFFQFASLQQLDSRSGCAIIKADIHAYSKDLLELMADMEVRFQDVFQLEVPDWMIDPFGNIISENGFLEEELITLKSDLELKPKFQPNQSFWLQNKIKERYSHVWDWVKLFMVVFPSSYSVERAFSAVLTLLDSKRNRLEIVNRGDLKLFLTKLKPDIDELITKHQPHPFH